MGRAEQSGTFSDSDRPGMMASEKPVEIVEVRLSQAGRSSYVVTIGDDDIGTVYRATRPGHVGKWGWTDGNLHVVGFETRKVAVRHMVWGNYEVWDGRFCLENNNSLFYLPETDKPPLPEA